MAGAGGGGGGGGSVCSMCGDVGFPDKLFRCARCRCRFQHSYCTGYYGEAAPAKAGAGVCDWCLCEAATAAAAGRNQRPSATTATSNKHQHQQVAADQDPYFSKGGCGKGKITGGEQEGGRRASRAGVRRYKLLKDVLC